MVRPSPFCILDEMDAPLDESNINRFIRVLDRFVSQSQFIIITHNKRTIAKADIFYGVTMEERGVSKLVGMKLAAEKGSDGELKRHASNGNGNGSDGAGTEAARQAQFAHGERSRRASPRRRGETVAARCATGVVIPSRVDGEGPHSRSCVTQASNACSTPICALREAVARTCSLRLRGPSPSARLGMTRFALAPTSLPKNTLRRFRLNG